MQSIKDLKKQEKERIKIEKEKAKIERLKSKVSKDENKRNKLEKKTGKENGVAKQIKVKTKKETTDTVDKKNVDKVDTLDLTKKGLWSKVKGFFFGTSRKWLINMELFNGMHRSFVLFTSKDEFNFLKNKYVIDGDLKYFNVDANCYALDYHQGFTLPVKREIPVSNIKKAIESSGLTEVENATNPSTLNNFIVSKVAEGVMKGQQIDHFFKQLRLLLIITAIASLLHLFLFAQKTGMLSKITGSLPF